MKTPATLLSVLGFTLLSASPALAWDGGYDIEPYEPGPGIDWSAVGKGIYDTSTGFGDWVGKRFEDAKVAGCGTRAKPMGMVLYRHPGAGQDAQLRKGQYEGLETVSREGSVLHLITQSGEYIDYPLAEEAQAIIAMQELCTDSRVYVDLSGCRTVADHRLFESHSCESPHSVDRITAEAQMSAGLKAFAQKQDDGADVSVSIYAMRDACRAPLISFKGAAESSVVLPTWDPSERAHSELFKRGVARMRAYRLAHETGESTEGFTYVSGISCVDSMATPVRD